MRMGKTYLLSDLHFGHRMLVEHGYRPEGFEDKIVENTLALAGGMDNLVFLGDLYFSREGGERLTKLLDTLRLQGVRTALVRGNHDQRSNRAYMDMGFTWSCDGMYLSVDGKRVLLTHIPAHVTTPVSWDLNIHGHLHAIKHDGVSHRKEHPGNGRVLVSMELLDYRPVELLHTVQLGYTPMYRGGRFMKYACKCTDCTQKRAS